MSQTARDTANDTAWQTAKMDSAEKSTLEKLVCQL